VKRERVDLYDIAGRDNLAAAVHRASRGKRDRPEVDRFTACLSENLAALSEAILTGRAPANHFTAFTIHDPKRRVIHAPCFTDRVVHHAFIARAGQALERALVDSSHACRKGKGNLTAIRAVQRGLQRFPWTVQIDIRAYFDSIDHGILKRLLGRVLKGDGLAAFIDRILAGYHTRPGVGLPIGALTSQYFANLYLDGLDRFLLEEEQVSAHVRYMDDSVWFCASKEAAKRTARAAAQWLPAHRRLTLKGVPRINRSVHGLTFCGFRVLRGCLRLTRRRKRRYHRGRLRWEALAAAGLIDPYELQAAYAAVHSIAATDDSLAWRRRQLHEHPPVDV